VPQPEFHRADEVIDIGQELAAAALDTLGAGPASDSRAPDVDAPNSRP
jgi:hypothetical protein